MVFQKKNVTIEKEVVQETKQVEKVSQLKPRNKRKSFGSAQLKLQVDQTIDGFHIRWVNDEPGRLQYAQDCGYSFVEPEEVKWEANKESRIKVLAGTQKDKITPMYTYLMKLPMEYYLEDKKLYMEKNKQFEDAIRGGKLDREPGDGRYIPSGGISYKP